MLYQISLSSQLKLPRLYHRYCSPGSLLWLSLLAGWPVGIRHTTLCHQPFLCHQPLVSPTMLLSPTMLVSPTMLSPPTMLSSPCCLLWSAQPCLVVTALCWVLWYPLLIATIKISEYKHLGGGQCCQSYLIMYVICAASRTLIKKERK